jgi:hypothetical protein
MQLLAVESRKGLNMSTRVSRLSFILAALAAATAHGQAPTTVQLPTFNFTTVNTTVSVPDQGAALLGGISRARDGSTSRGVPLLSKVPGANRLFTNRGIGREMGASSFSVSARIIDLAEEEQRQVGSVLAARNSAGGGLLPAISETDRKADFLSRNVGRQSLDPLVSESDARLPSVEEIRRRNELAQQQRDAEAALYFEKGQQAERAGKMNVAKIYYDMAARRGAVAASSPSSAGASYATTSP